MSQLADNFITCAPNAKAIARDQEAREINTELYEQIRSVDSGIELRDKCRINTLADKLDAVKLKLKKQ